MAGTQAKVQWEAEAPDVLGGSHRGDRSIRHMGAIWRQVSLERVGQEALKHHQMEKLGLYARVMGSHGGFLSGEQLDQIWIRSDW